MVMENTAKELLLTLSQWNGRQKVGPGRCAVHSIGLPSSIRY
jgi:hypothetical protein